MKTNDNPLIFNPSLSEVIATNEKRVGSPRARATSLSLSTWIILLTIHVLIRRVSCMSYEGFV